MSKDIDKQRIIRELKKFKKELEKCDNVVKANNLIESFEARFHTSLAVCDDFDVFDDMYQITRKLFKVINDFRLRRATKTDVCMWTRFTISAINKKK